MLAQKNRRKINRLRKSSYHFKHRQIALRVLSKLELIKGKTNPDDIKAAREYAIEVLGWRGYAPWLYVFTAVNGRFLEGWVPDNYYGDTVVPAINGSLGELSAFKSLNRKIFNSQYFPDLAYNINGSLYDLFYHEVDSPIDMLFSRSEKIVFKSDNSLQGKGIHFIDRSNYEAHRKSKPRNGVYQSHIDQHEIFELFNHNAVATLRLTTVINLEGEPTLRACYVRIAAARDTHVKSATHIRVPVSRINGQLGSIGYLPDWTTVKRCPESATLFENQSIPNFGECVKTVIELHRAIQPVGAIGWDVCVDKNNAVQVMEWNGAHNDIKFSEATQGPCFGDLGWESLWTCKR